MSAVDTLTDQAQKLKVQLANLREQLSIDVKRSPSHAPPQPEVIPNAALAAPEAASPHQLIGYLLVKDGLVTQSQLDEALHIQERLNPSTLIGQILVNQGVISARQLNTTLDRYAKRSRLGQVLVQAKVLTQTQLALVLEQQQEIGLRLGEALVKLNYISEETMRRALSAHLNIPFLDLQGVTPDQQLTRLVNKSYAKTHRIVPISLADNTVTIAMDDPTDVRVIEEIQSFTGSLVNVVTTTYPTLQRLFARLYDGDAQHETDAVPQPERIMESRSAPAHPDDDREAGPAASILRQILRTAVEHRASDIHLETLDGQMHARFRIDGQLQDLKLDHLAQAVLKSGPSIISRIKILAHLDISERRRPQDGSFRARVEKDGHVLTIDCRVSIIPGYYGENTLVRLLDPRNAPKSVDALGFSKRITDELCRLLQRPTGIIVITGPTGAGKSTTLFGALMTAYRPGIKVLTVENPIEYVHDKFTQCEVNERIGNSFAGFLRAFLRHDPEVIMLGEIRDQESAELAFRAAQTGHLVMSTLHTNDAVSAITRLLDLGLDTNVVTSALSCVLAQRLVRKNCERCRKEHAPPESLLHEFFDESPPDIRWYKGPGCAHCNFTGYKGRLAVAELWIPSNNDVLLINKRAPFDEIVASARKSTISMAEDVRERLRDGSTSLEELIRTLPYSSLHQFRELL
jgi:type II secretory ATPase GspE/PulE/Tfp pilus assembly ATPase PilB-like protein